MKHFKWEKAFTATLTEVHEFGPTLVAITKEAEFPKSQGKRSPRVIQLS